MLYLWMKASHLIAMVCWFAGLFYLPRLFVYHAKQIPGSETALTLQTMSERLARIIMLPAMTLTYVFGLVLVHLQWEYLSAQLWFYVKIFLVLLLSGYHGFLVRCMKEFRSGANARSPRFYIVLNEIPTLFLFLIIFLVVLKPF